MTQEFVQHLESRRQFLVDITSSIPNKSMAGEIVEIDKLLDVAYYELRPSHNMH